MAFRISAGIFVLLCPAGWRINAFLHSRAQAATTHRRSMSQKAHENDRQTTGKSLFCCNRDQKVPPRGISKQAKIWANWCVRVSPSPSWAPFSTPELLDAPVWGLTERMRNGLPRTESPSPVFARVRRYLSHKTARGQNGEQSSTDRPLKNMRLTFSRKLSRTSFIFIWFFLKTSDASNYLL